MTVLKVKKTYHVINVQVVDVLKQKWSACYNVSTELASSTYNGHVVVDVSVDHLLHVRQILVAVSTQLESQAPEGRHHRSTDHRGVQLNDVLGAVADKDEEVEDAAEGLDGKGRRGHCGES